jgi:hypothetical protein
MTITVDHNIGSEKAVAHIEHNLGRYEAKFGLEDHNLHLMKSGVPGKRLKLVVEGPKYNKVINFGYRGDSGHAEAFVDLIDKDPQLAHSKKRLYIRRASHILNGQHELTFNKRLTANSLAYWILWHCKNCSV